MKNICLGATGIVAPQNGFGALPVQRDDVETAVRILRRAYEGGMRYFDTARAYTDSEEKLGRAFAGYAPREQIYIATKTHAPDVKGFWEDLKTSLRMLRTDYIDVYQFHQMNQCYKPGDGTGMYEAMLEAKDKGLIRHIAGTAHKLPVAMEAAESGLYGTIQFPFSYLSGRPELELLAACRKSGTGFIAMKGLAGGLLTNSRACMAFMTQYEDVMPIWGIQHMSELEEWLSYMQDTPVMTAEMEALIERDRKALSGEFCRGCGYCMPCTVGIKINNCARISQMIRRSPSAQWLSPSFQAEMRKIEDCVDCGLCRSRCPYELDTPALLQKNLADYKRILSGEEKI